MLTKHDYLLLKYILDDPDYYSDKCKVARKCLDNKACIQILYNGHYVYYSITKLGYSLYNQYTAVLNSDYSI